MKLIDKFENLSFNTLIELSIEYNKSIGPKQAKTNFVMYYIFFLYSFVLLTSDVI